MFLVVSKIILIARFCILSTCSDNLLGMLSHDILYRKYTSMSDDTINLINY